MWTSLRALKDGITARRAQVWELVTAVLAITAAFEGAGRVAALGVGAVLAGLKTFEADR